MQNICCVLYCLFGVEGNEIVVMMLYWLMWMIFQVDVIVIEMIMVVEEVVVYCIVVMVFDMMQFVIMFVGVDVIVDGILLVDVWCKLYILFMVVMFGVCFVGKYVGWVNFDQVIGKFVFQCVVFWVIEVDVVVCIVNVQICIVSVIFVVMYVVVVGDVVVYFVRDEWF